MRRAPELSAKEFEQYVAELLRGLAFVEKGTVTTNRRFKGVRQPGAYEIDVAVEVQLAATLKFRLIVECKNWTRPVDRPVVQKLAQTRDAVGADKAAIASPVGFTAEAEEVARTLGITLWIVTVREWIVVETIRQPTSAVGTIEHRRFSSRLLERDANRDWNEKPAQVETLTWRGDPMFLHVITDPDGLPDHLRWTRFVPIYNPTYAINAQAQVDSWAHEKLLRFDDDLWSARVRGTIFHEPDAPDWPSQ